MYGMVKPLFCLEFLCVHTGMGSRILRRGATWFYGKLSWTGIDQFQNLEGIAGRILGYFSQGPTFFVREILDGIAAQPGGNYICSIYRHRQVVPQSRVKYHGLPEAPLVRADHDS